MEFRRLARSYNLTCGGRAGSESRPGRIFPFFLLSLSLFYKPPISLIQTYSHHPSHSIYRAPAIKLQGKRAVSGWKRRVAPVGVLVLLSGVAEPSHPHIQFTQTHKHSIHPYPPIQLSLIPTIHHQVEESHPFTQPCPGLINRIPGYH